MTAKMTLMTPHTRELESVNIIIDKCEPITVAVIMLKTIKLYFLHTTLG